MKDQFTKELITKIIIYAVLILAAYFLIIRPVLIKIGIIKSAEDKKREKTVAQYGTATDSPFSPSLWKKGGTVLTKASAEKLADQINDAIGFFSDDENEVYGAMRQLKTKTQLSFLADIFQQRHKMDLYQLLNRNFSDSEMDVINGIANNLA